MTANIMLGPALGAKNTICYDPELMDQQAVIEKIKHSQCVRDANAESEHSTEAAERKAILSPLCIISNTPSPVASWTRCNRNGLERFYVVV